MNLIKCYIIIIPSALKIYIFQNAVSMYCRLGFAKKKGQDDTSHLHPSWKKQQQKLPK